ncbi:MAG: hypothetical protein ABSA63_06090 [Thermoplasmata archaeon]|jgi:hypothetical protein
MAPRALTVTFAVTAIAIVVILFLWVYPGYLATPTNCPSHVTLSGHAYCAETVTLGQSEACPGPQGCSICPTSNFSFQGALFQWQLTNTSSGALLQGCASYGNTTGWHFLLSADPLSSFPLNWTSKDHALAILWQPPFAHTDVDGLLQANVTFGVALALA